MVLRRRAAPCRNEVPISDPDLSTFREHEYRPASDTRFYVCLGLLSSVYVIILVAMLAAEITYTTPGHILSALKDPNIQYAVRLSLLSCTVTAILALWVAVPIGYLMSRCRFPGKAIVDAVLDIPIVLPPLVVGLCLLILFQTGIGHWIEQFIPFTYAIPGIILAQFMVAGAFAIRTLRVTFDQINPRCERVALTLGCSRAQAFWRVVMPEARNGLLTAGTMAWARALGEFGPVLIFAGATRMRTEVLPTSIYLELTVGNIEGAVAVSILMTVLAVTALILMRVWGMSGQHQKGQYR